MEESVSPTYKLSSSESSDSPEEVESVVIVGDSPTLDTSNDCNFNGLDCDGGFAITDVYIFFENRNYNFGQNNVALFDFSDGGAIGISNVQVLFKQLQN